ncbi:MAG TPA: ATP-binding protein [Candidatus Sulfotelmatobacter sp.]|jgi:PAS domain S-box-containing protein|nr:ATP-binding protein [Candidatus Sulfotelmatobacter sp.]
MLRTSISENEKERLDSLHNLDILDTPPAKRFDLITKTATRLFHVPISTLTVMDAKREWFKSSQGLSMHEEDRAISFCGHTLLSNKIFVISDTKKDTRFVDNPMVTGKPYVRFYAGLPVMSADGDRIGVFCIKDIRPREFSKADEEMLKGLAFWAEAEVNYHNMSFAFKEERRAYKMLKVQMQNFERIDKSREEIKKAMLNVMEDLETARITIETKNAKDEAMLASIGEGLIAVDNKSKIVMVNRAAEEMLGLKAKELINKIITTLYLESEDGNPIPLEKRPSNIALSTGKITNVTYFFVKKDKTRFPLSINVTPITLGGKTIGLIETLRDVSREKEIDLAKSEFVSLASHQLRTPLGIIKWYLEALTHEEYFLKAPQKLLTYLDEIYKNNERLLSLVRDLLSVSRIDQGKVKNDQKLMNPVKVIKEIVAQMAIVARKKHIALHVIVRDKKLPSILIDVFRFREILENLIANAIEYTLDNGSVDIIIKRIGNILEISVRDMGIGISLIDQKKLFTKFFRSEDATEYNPGGSGLGLYVVKSYVESLGGKVKVTSKVGKGSLFIIQLPIFLNR